MVDAESWMQDMDLLYHYTSVVSHSQLGATPEVENLWRTVIVEEAMKYDFLLHGILALSAQSKARMYPADNAKYQRLCAKHQNTALLGYRERLQQEVTVESSCALFAFASLVSMTAQASSCAAASAMPGPKMLSMYKRNHLWKAAIVALTTLYREQVAEIFHLTMGVRNVVGIAHDFLKVGRLSGMLEGYSIPEAEERSIQLPASVTARFEAVQGLIDELEAHDASRQVPLTEALQYLNRTYRIVKYFAKKRGVLSGHVWSWTATIPVEYTRLIEARHPVALVILAYFATATMAMEQGWYKKDWGTYCIRGIGQELEPSMQKWLQWPRQQMEDSLAILQREE